MKQIKYLVMTFAAVCLTAGLTSCEKEVEKIVEKPVEVEKIVEKEVEVEVPVPQDNNWSRYQAIVTSDVLSQKKHDKVILLVAFGSTWQQAFNAFDETKAAYQEKFPDYDVFLSYSSAICINRAAAGENAADGAEIRNYYAPPFWLNAFADKDVQYEEIVVQSLQVIPGEEYTRVINYIKDFANNANGDLDDTYLANVTLKLGVPLLQDAEADVNLVAKELNALYSNKVAEGVVAFMGHGNPDSYDTYKANIRYSELEAALQTYSKNYFVGTVDMMDNFKTHVYQRMQKAGISSGKVYLHPLMSIDGDHGHNDMGGDDDDNWKDGVGFTPNEEGEVEDTSWKKYFQHLGFECNDETVMHYGLLELPTIRQVWMNHTQDAIDGEPLDYYHSKNPE